MAQTYVHKLSIGRVAVAGALTAVVFYVLCWVGAFLPVGPATHMYLGLFTAEKPGTAFALLQGACWSVAFGLIVGGLFALSYNLLAGLDRD